MRRLTGALLTLTLVVSLGAQCLAGQQMTAEQMACCAGTDHDCQTAVATADCCQRESADDEAQLVAHVHQPAPALAPISSAIPGLAPPPERSSNVSLDTTALTGSPPPRYLLLGAFLI